MCLTDEYGKRRVAFNGEVTRESYYLGRKFCASVPKEVEKITATCVSNNGAYQIQYSRKVSAKSHKKAEKFCTCALGLTN